MAKIIPSYIQNSAPPGEKMIFGLLKSHQTSDDWVVFHSYNLPRHKTQLEGEIDFLFIVPGQGVLVLEVKSHTSVSRREGMWKLGNDPETPRSPFDQASNAMYSLRDTLGKDLARGIAFTYAVAFTSLTFSIPSTEWHSWQVIDEKSMTAEALVEAIRKTLSTYRQQLAVDKDDPLKRRAVGWFDPARGEPTQERVSEICRKLRGNFEVFVDLKRADQHFHNEYLSFLQEQFEAIDAMETMKSVFFEGSAGTGKTLLAIEAARRSVHRNHRVLLLCYNRLLGHHLRREVEIDDGFRGTIHSFMRTYRQLDRCFYDEEDTGFDFKQAVQLSSSQRLFEEQFDEIVVDEVQDLCAIGAKDLLAEIVRQNPSASVRVFGDFQNQDIQVGPGRILEHEEHNSRESFLTSIPSLITYRLSRNCRNRPGVGEVIEFTTGLNDLYTGYRLPPSKGNFDIEEHEYPVPGLVYERLFQQLTREFLPHRIAILGCSRQVQVNEFPPKLQRFFTNDVDRWTPNGTTAISTTVRKFKGMDAQAIILTELPENLDSSLLYTGISRAIEKVVIICPPRISADIGRRIVTRGRSL